MMSDAPKVIDQILTTSRPMDEYVAMFGLSDSELRLRILDCAAGASSFAAECDPDGLRVVACDPEFRREASALAKYAQREVRRGNEYVRSHPDEYVWTFFDNADDHLSRRSSAASEFAVDLPRNPSRYLPARLPSLPFANEAFDLTLCSHLLFSYADRMSFDFHVQAITELARVTAGEVRIFPLVAMGTFSYPLLGELIDSLREAGIRSEIKNVDYEFQRGAKKTLTCWKG